MIRYRGLTREEAERLASELQSRILPNKAIVQEMGVAE
jgi:hypothetical protein